MRISSCLLIFILLLSAPVFAASNHDVVRLKSGAVFKGEIAEQIPGEYVVIKLITGDVRKIPMAEVEYAGPQESAKPTARVSTKVSTNETQAKVHFTTEKKTLTVHQEVAKSRGTFWAGYSTGTISSESFRRICTLPCTASLPKGKQPLALSLDDGFPVSVDEHVDISGPTYLQARYTSNSGVRLAGWVIGIGSVLTGLLVLISPDIYMNDSGLDQLYLGTGIMLAGLPAWIMAEWEDDAELVLTPAGGGRASTD
jgi:hypothetical protein